MREQTMLQKDQIIALHQAEKTTKEIGEATKPGPKALLKPGRKEASSQNPESS